MPGAAELVAFVKKRLAARPPEYDWQPTVEPPGAPLERNLTPCQAPEFYRPSGSVDDARQIIRDALAEYLGMAFPEHILLIKSLPGTGKTTLAVEAVDAIAASGRRVAYAGPRHDLFADIIAKSTRPADWYEWLPRQAGDPDTGQIQTCNYAAQMSAWLDKGYQAIDFCSGVCGWDYVNSGCVYYAQKKRLEQVIYTQHQHVTLGHPVQFDVLIGDESPLQAFAHEWRIPGRWILPPGMDPTDPMTEIISGLTTIAGSTERSVQGPELLDLLGGPEYVLEACQSYEIPVGALAYGSRIYRPEQVEQTPYFHLPNLALLLAREAKQAAAGIKYPFRIIISPGFLTLLLQRQPDPRQIPPHVVWLDATGRPDIYRKIFNRPVQVIDAAPRMFGKIYQVVDRANGKQATIKNGQLTAKAKQSETAIERIIQDYEYQNPTVISYKNFVENTRLEGVKTAHFYASRGTNEHETADAVFILGAPQANFYDIVKLAKMLFFDRDVAFKVEWVTRLKPYNFVGADGLGRAYPVAGFWNDPDLQSILETVREDEIIQAAHRGRPVNHSVDIWLFTNVPIDSLPPDELLTLREIMGAPTGVDTFKWELVQQLMARQESITLSDIIGLGISRKTASAYLDRVAAMPGWEKAVTRMAIGRPRKTVQKTGLSRNDVNNII